MENDSCSNVIDEDEILIDLVAEKSFLYDKSSSQFKDTQKKNEAWNEIAANMFMLTERPTEVKFVISRWKGLKKKYMDERKRLLEYIPSGSAAPAKSCSWKYYQLMNFLEKHVQHRQTFSNFNLRVGDENSDSEDADDEGLMYEGETDNSAPDAGRKSPTSVNNYLLVLRDAWNKIPEKNKKKCFFKLRDIMRKKKD